MKGHPFKDAFCMSNAPFHLIVLDPAERNDFLILNKGSADGL